MENIAQLGNACREKVPLAYMLYIGGAEAPLEDSPLGLRRQRLLHCNSLHTQHKTRPPSL